MSETLTENSTFQNLFCLDFSRTDLFTASCMWLFCMQEATKVSCNLCRLVLFDPDWNPATDAQAGS
jgi:hypothetical protein